MTQLPTGRGLLIAEKRSAKETYQEVYDQIKTQLPYTLDFQMFKGHVTELGKPKDLNPDWGEWKEENLPMIPKKWRYIPEPDPKKGVSRYKDVKNSIERGNYDFIICATDYEREGNLIFDAFISTLDPAYQRIPKYRMWGKGMSTPEITNSYNSLLSYQDILPGFGGTVQNLSDAALLRAKFDWLIGLNSTQLISLKAGYTIPTGRVKDPILDLIVERELEIRNFVPTPFWTISGEFKTNSGETYQGKLIDGDTGELIKFNSKEDAEKALVAVQAGNEARISKVNQKRVNQKPKLFYSTGTLQGDAADIYGIPQVESLAAVAALYENKIISYPRTDSNFISKKMAEVELEDVIRTALNVPGLENLTMPTPSQLSEFTKNKSYVNDDKVGAHTALQPLIGAPVHLKMTETQAKILYLIARSQLLPFQGDLVKNNTEIYTEYGEYLFKTTGSVIIEKGWTAHVPEFKSKDKELPAVSEGEMVEPMISELKEGITTPPKRYTVSSLATVLENIHRLIENDADKLAMKEAEGLGRPSTRTSIINSLIEHEMITCKGKKQEYAATDFGIDLIKAFGNSDMISPTLTASWERRLQELERGNITKEDLYKQIVDYAEKIIENLKNKGFEIKNIPGYAKGKEAIGVLANTGTEVFEGKTGYYDTEFTNSLAERKKAEEDGLGLPDIRGFYTPKKLDNDTFKMVGSFSRSDIAALISNNQIEKEFIWKKYNNKKSKKKLELDSNLKISFVKGNSSRTTESFTAGSHQIVFISGTKDDGTEYAFYQVDGDDQFLIWMNLMGAELSKEDIITIMTGGEVLKELQKKDKSKFQAYVFIDSQERKIKLKYPERAQIVADEIYNKDGNKIVRLEGNYGPYYRINDEINVSEICFGHEMLIDELILLATKGKVYIPNFVSKKNTNFSAYLVLDPLKKQAVLQFD